MRINVTNIIPSFNFNILNTYFQLEKVLVINGRIDHIFQSEDS